MAKMAASLRHQNSRPGTLLGNFRSLMPLQNGIQTMTTGLKPGTWTGILIQNWEFGFKILCAVASDRVCSTVALQKHFIGRGWIREIPKRWSGWRPSSGWIPGAELAVWSHLFSIWIRLKVFSWISCYLEEVALRRSCSTPLESTLHLYHKKINVGKTVMVEVKSNFEAYRVFPDFPNSFAR